MLLGGLGLLILMSRLRPDDAARLRAQAEAAAHDGDRARAVELWRRLNATYGATAATLLSEGRACLARGLAGQAERALRRAVAADPRDSEAWLVLLKILRVEDRLVDTFQLGWTAVEQVDPEARVELLRELTLAALTDLPDDLARTTLTRWIESDPTDIDARAAFFRRLGTEPRSADPDREARLAELTKLLASHPDHLGVREALVTALADAGDPDRGRTILEAWPPGDRDGRYWRLQGRWDLEHNHWPEQAVTALRSAIVEFPQDWRTHYRLARALKILGRTEEARQEAETVSRIRELLDPLFLEPKLEASFAHLDRPAAREVLAELCTRAGLVRLADAWRAIETDRPGNGHRPGEVRTGAP